MIRNIITLFVVLFTFSTHFHGAAENLKSEVQMLYANSKEGQALLNSKPKYEKEGVPQATVGVIPYAFNKEGKLVILFGREGEKRGWSDFGGKPEPTDKSFLAATVRELNEESARVYNDSSRNALDSQAIILYVHKTGTRQIIYLICPVTYYPPEKFMQAQEKAKTENWGKEYLEKDKFAWVSLVSFAKLREAGKLEIPEDEGNLWGHFQSDVIDSPRFIDVLELLKLIEQQSGEQKEAA